MPRFQATIRLTVKVPFRATGKTDAQRIAAAVHAETKLVDRLSKAIGRHGIVIAALVEEVAELEEPTT